MSNFTQIKKRFIFKYRILDFCLLFLLIIGFVPGIKAQQISLKADSVEICSNAGTILKVYAEVFEKSTNGGTITIKFPSGINYVPGSVHVLQSTTGISLSEQSFADLNQPVFKLAPDSLDVGDHVEFTVKRIALCEVINTSVDVIKDTVTVELNGNKESEITEKYKVLKPSITFEKPADIPDVVRIGESEERIFIIKNGANQAADSVYFSIEYKDGALTQTAIKITKIGTNIVNIPLSPVSTTGNISYYTLSGSNLGADMQLTNGEVIAITETITVNKCFATTNYTVGWGCDSTPANWCETKEGTSIVNVSAGQPNYESGDHDVKFIRDSYVNACTPFQIQLTYTNSGAGPMYNLKCHNYDNWKGVAIELSEAKVGTTNVDMTFRDSLGSSLDLYEVQFDTVHTDPDGENIGLEDIDGDGCYDDLPANATVTITVTVTTNGIWDKNSYLYYWRAYLTYDDPCVVGKRVISSRLNVRHPMGIIGQGGPVGQMPANVNAGVPFGVYLCTSRNRVKGFRTSVGKDIHKMRYEYVLKLPDYVQLASTPNAKWKTGENNTDNPDIPDINIPDSNIIKSADGKTIIIRAPDILAKVSHHSWGGAVYIDLVIPPGSCSEIPADRFVKIPYQYRRIDDITVTPFCRKKGDLTEGILSAKLVGGCEGVCSSGGVSVDIPIVRRTDKFLGWTDYSMTTKQSRSQISPSEQQRAMYLDEIEIISRGVQNYGTAITSGQNTIGVQVVMLKDNGEGNILEPLSAEISITKGTNTPIKLEFTDATKAVISSSSDNKQQIINWDLSEVLTNNGILLEENDKIDVITRYRVISKNLDKADKLVGISYFMYNTNAEATQKYNCNDAIPSLYVAQLYHSLGCNTWSVKGCKDVYFAGGIHIANRFTSSGKIFKDEYRPAAYITKIEFEIPEGYGFSDVDKVLTYTEFKEHQWGIDKTIEVSLSELTKNGNTYIYENKGQLKPILTTVTNFYTSRLIFNLKPECGVVEQNFPARIYVKNYYYAYGKKVGGEYETSETAYDEVWVLKNKKILPLSQPAIKMVVSPAQNLKADEPIEEFAVQYENISGNDAPVLWLAIPKIPGFKVESVTEEETGNVFVGHEYSGVEQGYIYHLSGEEGATKPFESKTFAKYKIKFSYEGTKVKKTIKIKGGWNCENYPVSPEEYTCGMQEVDFTFTPQLATIGLRKVKEINTKHDLCELLEYEYEIINIERGNAVDLAFAIIPANNMEIQDVQIEYPRGSGDWQEASQITINSGVHTYDLTTHTAYNTFGLPGTFNDQEDANNRIIGIKFNVKTKCGFISGSNFAIKAIANSNTGSPAIGSNIEYETPRIEINGVTTPYVMTNKIETEETTISSCGTEILLKGTAVITATGGMLTDESGKINITLPEGYKYVDGSFVPTSGLSGVTVTQNATNSDVVTLKIASGLSAKKLSYSIKMQETSASSHVACQTVSVKVTSTVSSTPISCNSSPCTGVESVSVTGASNLNLVIEKPNLALSIDDVKTIYDIDAKKEKLTVSYTVVNNTAIDYTGNLIIRLYDDVNKNGTIDTTVDKLIDTQTKSIASIDDFSGKIEHTVNDENICNLLLSISTKDNMCICSSVVKQIATPITLDNIAGTDETVCSDDSVVIGTINNENYTYSWEDVTYLSEKSIAQPTFKYTGVALDAITKIKYKVTATRKGGCSTTDTVIVTVNPIPKINITGDNQLNCKVTEIILDGSGSVVQGSSPVFQWAKDSVNIDGATELTYTLNEVGKYTLKITDDNSCSNEKDFVVSKDITKPTASASITHVKCNGGNDGEIKLASNGVNFKWKDGVPTRDRTGLSAGTYTVTVKKANECSKDFVYEITEPDKKLDAKIKVNDTNICENKTKPIITLSGFNGTAPYTFKYEINSGSELDITTANNLDTINIEVPTKTPGNYTYRITNVSDSNACNVQIEKELAVEITVDPASEGGEIAKDTTVCAGTNKVILNLSNNIGNILRWESSTDNFSTKTNIDKTTNALTAKNLTETTKYRAIVKSGVCAKKVSEAATITVEAVSEVTTQPANATYCEGEKVNTLNVIATGKNLKYQWYSNTKNNTTDGIAIDGETNSTYTPQITAAQTYYHYVTIEGDCGDTISKVATIIVNSIPKNDLIVSDPEICVGESAIITLNNSQPDVNYQLQNNATNENITSPQDGNGENLTFNISPNSTTEYKIIAINNTNTNCSTTLKDLATIIVNPIPEISISDDQQKFCEEEIKILKDIPISATNIHWYMNEDLTNIIADTSRLKTGIYYGIAISDKNCKSEVLRINVILEKCNTDVIIPDGFSPNGDGINDKFIINGIEKYPNNTITIINRWGNKIYQAQPYKNDWDGKNMFGLHVNGEELPEGTYFYILKYKEQDGKNKVKKGYIYLKK